MNERTSTTVIGLFRDVSPDQFEDVVNRVWQSAERIKNTICEQVATGELPTLTGLSMIACVTGQAFSYGLFHGQPASADLLGDLSVGLDPRLTGELAGQR